MPKSKRHLKRRLKIKDKLKHKKLHPNDAKFIKKSKTNSLSSLFQT